MTLWLVLGAGLAGLGFIVWLALRERRAGAAAAIRDQAIAAAEALERMADAEAKAPRDRTELVKRLREGGGL